MEFLKNNPGCHTGKEIGIAFGQKLSRASEYPKVVLQRLYEMGKIDRVVLPCQPVRYKWKEKEVNHV